MAEQTPWVTSSPAAEHRVRGLARRGVALGHGGDLDLSRGRLPVPVWRRRAASSDGWASWSLKSDQRRDVVEGTVRSSRTRSKSCCAISLPGPYVAGTSRSPSSTTARPCRREAQCCRCLRRRTTMSGASRIPSVSRSTAGRLSNRVRLRRAFLLGRGAGSSPGPDRLDEVLNRFPDWAVDLPNAYWAPTSTVRGRTRCRRSCAERQDIGWVDRGGATPLARRVRLTGAGTASAQREERR